MPNKHSILSLSLLSILAVLAVNASAASASWQLLRNAVAVSSLTLTGSVLLAEFLVPGLKTAIHCPEGASSGTVGTTTASITVVFKGCKVIGPICTIENAAGTIGEVDISATGKLTMKAGDNENITILGSSALIATAYLSGSKCTLPEETVISGSLTLLLLEALKDLVTHLAHLDDDGLLYGSEPMTIDGEAGAGAALAHIRVPSGQTYAIHLTGL